MSHFTWCLQVFAVQLFVALVSVFVPDSSTTLKLFLFGLVWSSNTITVAITLPFQAWLDNVKKVIIGLASLTHSIVLLAVQTGGTKSNYFIYSLVLFACVCLLLLFRRSLPQTYASCARRMPTWRACRKQAVSGATGPVALTVTIRPSAPAGPAELTPEEHAVAPGGEHPQPELPGPIGSLQDTVSGLRHSPPPLANRGVSGIDVPSAALLPCAVPDEQAFPVAASDSAWQLALSHPLPVDHEWNDADEYEPEAARADGPSLVAAISAAYRVHARWFPRLPSCLPLSAAPAPLRLAPPLSLAVPSAGPLGSASVPASEWEDADECARPAAACPPPSVSAALAFASDPFSPPCALFSSESAAPQPEPSMATPDPPASAVALDAAALELASEAETAAGPSEVSSADASSAVDRVYTRWYPRLPSRLPLSYAGSLLLVPSMAGHSPRLVDSTSGPADAPLPLAPLRRLHPLRLLQLATAVQTQMTSMHMEEPDDSDNEEAKAQPDQPQS